MIKVINNFNNKNQYLIKNNNEFIFQSYSTIIFEIKIKNDKFKIEFNKEESNYSMTTCKYLKLAIENVIDNLYNDYKLNRDLINELDNILNSGNIKKSCLSYKNF